MVQAHLLSQRNLRLKARHAGADEEGVAALSHMGADAVERLRGTLHLSRTHPDEAAGELIDWLREDRTGMIGALLQVIRRDANPSGLRFIEDFLIENDLFPFCDPQLASEDEELLLVRAMAACDPLLDTKLARRISPGVDRASPGAPVNERILALLAEISDGSRILPTLIQLLRHGDPRLRSKAALLVGRWRHTAAWLGRRNRDRDARVRANGVEAMWGADSTQVRALMREAARDRDNRVAGNALFGLYRLGELECIPAILEMAVHRDLRCRSTAAWVMGQTEDPRFLEALERLREEEDRALRFNALRALARIRRSAAQCREAGRLAVRIVHAVHSPGGVLLRAGIAPEGGDALPELPGTCFIPYRDPDAVTRFTVVARVSGGAGSTNRAVAVEYCYEIQFQAEPGSRDVRLEVCSKHGWGEARAALAVAN